MTTLKWLTGKFWPVTARAYLWTACPDRHPGAGSKYWGVYRESSADRAPLFQEIAAHGGQGIVSVDLGQSF